MFHFQNILADCEVLNLSNFYDKEIRRDLALVVVVGVVLTIKYQSVHSKRNNLVGLVEILLTDESSRHKPVIFQSWGQSASDKFRYSICAGSTLVLCNVVVNSIANSGQIVLNGDIACILNGLYEDKAMSALLSSDRCSSTLHRKLEILEEWRETDELLSLIRKKPTVAVRVASVADITTGGGSTSKAQLFSLRLSLSIKDHDSPEAEGSIVRCVDSAGAAVKLQLTSAAHLEMLRHVVEQYQHSAGRSANGPGSTVEIYAHSLGVGSAYQNLVKRLVTTSFTAFEVKPTDRPGGAVAVLQTEHQNANPVEEVAAEETVEVVSWEGLCEMAGDTQAPLSDSGALLLVRCILRSVHFASDGGRDRDRDASKARRDLSATRALKRNICVVRETRAPVVSEPPPPPLEQRKRRLNECEDEHTTAQAAGPPPAVEEAVTVLYRDVRFVFGPPASPAPLTAAQRVAAEALYPNCTLVGGPVEPKPVFSGHASTTPRSLGIAEMAEQPRLQWSLSSGSRRRSQITAVAHDACVTRLLCGIPASLVAQQLSAVDSAEESDCAERTRVLAGFDWAGATTRLMSALQRSAEKQQEVLVVVRLHPVADENGTLTTDCVFTVEQITAAL